MTALPPRPTHDFNPLKFSLPVSVTAAERRHLVATAAYLRAAARGFVSGHDVADWLAAEAEIEKRFGPSPQFTTLG